MPNSVTRTMSALSRSESSIWAERRLAIAGVPAVSRLDPLPHSHGRLATLQVLRPARSLQVWPRVQIPASVGQRAWRSWWLKGQCYQGYSPRRHAASRCKNFHRQCYASAGTRVCKPQVWQRSGLAEADVQFIQSALPRDDSIGTNFLSDTSSSDYPRCPAHRASTSTRRYPSPRHNMEGWWPPRANTRSIRSRAHAATEVPTAAATAQLFPRT